MLSAAASSSDLVVLCGPVLTILDWLDRLAPVLKPGQLVTDVGSVKGVLVEHARRPLQPARTCRIFAGTSDGGQGSERGGERRCYIFLTARHGCLQRLTESRSMHAASRAIADEWRGWTEKFNCCVLDLDAERHDVLCAWVSHLPQFVSTALSALLQDEFAAKDEVLPIGGRALREMTRLGASPYSMWRDVAHTNTEAIAASLLALEQRLTHLRENLKTPELREEFERANQFRPVVALTETIASREVLVYFSCAALFFCSLFPFRTLLAAAQQSSTLLVDVDHRPTISLDGPWHFIVDPYHGGWGSNSDVPGVRRVCRERALPAGRPAA